MFSRSTRQIIKYGSLGAVCAGTVLSLRSNNYDINSIGVVRLGRAAATVFDISLNYKRKLYSHNLEESSKEYKLLKSQCHTEGAEKLLQLCCSNKGVYIKVGQHLAALDYLLPSEYVKILKILHSHAPNTSVDEIYRVIGEELGHELAKKLFKTIDPEPLGTASLAQVHRAVLDDGTIIAVKVQHPYVRGNSLVDMRTMELLVKIVSWIFPDFKFQWLVDETKTNIPRELDFTQEGHNAEKLQALYKHRHKWLRVPKIIWELSTSRVLTMEYVDGGQVNNIEYIVKEGIDPYEVSDKLGILYSDMIFRDGFVHSDPHPGNILVKKNQKGHCDIILLDHGLYAELSKDFRTEYAELWLSILNVDRPAMRLHCTKLGIQSDMYALFTCMLTGRSWEQVLTGVDKHAPDQKERDQMSKELPKVLPHISSILDSVDRQMLLVLKSNDLLRGIEYALGTHNRMYSFKVMSQRCIRTAYGERMRQSDNVSRRFVVRIAKYWALFKFSLYYTFMNAMSFRFHSCQIA